MSKQRNNEPVHLELYRTLDRKIRQGLMARGEVLPSDQELAREYGVSRYTAREAYSELVRNGLVQRVRRRGTVVIWDPAKAKVRKIGLILVADVPAYYLFQKGVEQVLGDRGAGIFVQYSFDDEQRSEAAIADALNHEIEGLIISPPTEGSLKTYRKLASKGFPIVLALASSTEVSCIHPDDELAGELVGEHFREQGFKRPAVLSQDRPYARTRVAGFRNALARHKVDLADERVIEVQYDDQEHIYLDDMGRQEVDLLLAKEPRPDALFAVNDSTAIAAYYWLNQRGIRVPEDIAVAGVDNLGRKFHPFQLTTVDIGLEDMGRAAAEAILRQLENPHAPVIAQQIEPKLVVSRSTARS